MPNLSALASFADDLARNGLEVMRPQIKKLGAAYKELLKQHPEALLFGRDAAPSAKDIAGKYGAKIDVIQRPYEGTLPIVRFSSPKGGLNLFYKTGQELMDEAVDAGFYGLEQAYRPGNHYGVIQAIENTQGTGAGNLYPAVLDYINKSGVKNATDTYVTPVNAWRKPLANTIGSMIRADKNIVVPHPHSLNRTHSTPVDYLQSDFDTQLGHNFVNGVLGMTDDLASPSGSSNLMSIRRDLANPKERQHLETFWGTNPDAVNEIDAFRPEYFDFMGLTGRSPAQKFNETAYLLNEAGVKSVGSASLRKAAIMDSLLQGSPFNTELLRGVEKREGGLAQISDMQY